MIISILVIGSLLPIWRHPPAEGGFNLWQLLVMRGQPRSHITAQEAIDHARSAYQQGYFNTAIGG